MLGKAPLFGICLGHQILGQALGGKTGKLKFGHHGINQPVKNKQTGRIEITSQNHGFHVLAETLPAGADKSHTNLNDRTSEGLDCPDLNAFSVQYHPEAAPGPHDAAYLFDRFVDLMTRTNAVAGFSLRNPAVSGKGEKNVILIIDFGSQYNQLIARRVREHHVYCQIEPPDLDLDRIRALKPEGHHPFGRTGQHLRKGQSARRQGDFRSRHPRPGHLLRPAVHDRRAGRRGGPVR